MSWYCKFVAGNAAAALRRVEHDPSIPAAAKAHLGEAIRVFPTMPNHAIVVESQGHIQSDPTAPPEYSSAQTKVEHVPFLAAIEETPADPEPDAPTAG